MKLIVLTILSLVVFAAAGAAGAVYLGLFNVAADEPHSPFVFAVMDTARVRSIKAHASGITVPAGYDAGAGMTGAAEHFSEHCVTCHGGPGTKPNEIAEGMYPKPPDLTHVSERYTPPELFWILRHGIKMSGMPSMADDGDAMLWSTVAFLQRLPSLSTQAYDDLLAKAQDSEGQSMAGMHMHGAGEGHAN